MRLYLFLVFMLLALIGSSQNVTREGNVLVEQRKKYTPKPEVRTSDIFRDTLGKEYDVYQSLKGGLYVYRISKSGKRYRYYIKE